MMSKFTIKDVSDVLVKDSNGEILFKSTTEKMLDLDIDSGEIRTVITDGMENDENDN